MCGIVGYDGDAEALPIVATSFKNLEYCDYDSTGIALAENGHLVIHKQTGGVDDLELPDSLPAHLGLGHTRWSTHGRPTDANAHPHTDCMGEIPVVHNGIVENYLKFKEELADHRFTSETDTEVIAHLLEETLEDDLREAVERVVDRLEGSFAIGVVASGHDGIVAARQDSPLVVGHGENGNFISSDVTAFLEHSREVTYLEDVDVAHVTDNGVTVYANGGACRARDPHGRLGG